MPNIPKDHVAIPPNVSNKHLDSVLGLGRGGGGSGAAGLESWNVDLALVLSLGSSGGGGGAAGLESRNVDLTLVLSFGVGVGVGSGCRGGAGRDDNNTRRQGDAAGDANTGGERDGDGRDGGEDGGHGDKELHFDGWVGWLIKRLGDVFVEM